MGARQSVEDSDIEDYDEDEDDLNEDEADLEEDGRRNVAFVSRHEATLPPFNTSDSPLAPLKPDDAFDSYLDRGPSSSSAQLGKGKHAISSLIDPQLPSQSRANNHSNPYFIQEERNPSQHENQSFFDPPGRKLEEPFLEPRATDSLKKNTAVPPPPQPPHIPTQPPHPVRKSSPVTVSERAVKFGIEFFVIRHAEATNNVTGLIGGRAPWATLTIKGQQQASILGRFLNEYSDLMFDFVYSSTLERARETADIVCKEIGFPLEMIQLDDRLQELSQGEWEGKPRDEIYTPEMRQKMNYGQPDFRPPAGESQRQVESRMIDSVLSIIEEAMETTVDVRKDHFQRHVPHQHHPHHKNSTPGSFSYPNNSSQRATEVQPPGYPSDTAANLIKREDSLPVRIAIFSHGSAIKCLLRGILHSDPRMTYKIRIDNTAVTVLKYSVVNGWHLDRINDMTHLVIANVPST